MCGCCGARSCLPYPIPNLNTPHLTSLSVLSRAARTVTCNLTTCDLTCSYRSIYYLITRQQHSLNVVVELLIGLD